MANISLSEHIIGAGNQSKYPTGNKDTFCEEQANEQCWWV